MTEVVAALIREDGKFLICRRPPHKARGGLWEFVGGKVEKGESREAALVRECREELNIEISVGGVFAGVVHEYADMTVSLTLFDAQIVRGAPQKIEHTDIRWITPAEIGNYDFCPADEDVLRQIKKKMNTEKRHTMTEDRTEMDKLKHERECLAAGYRFVAGVDEVGRGPLAGPVVAAAVILPLDEGCLIEGIDDSKKLSPKKRERLAAVIKERAVAYAIEQVEAETIDEINILQATRLCMKKAVEKLSIGADMVLTDGNMTLDIVPPQRSIVHGDALSYSVGAASILAKVYRDALMDKYAAEFPQYGFAKNKGYGTAAHIAAIREYGLCAIHRRTFTKNF